VQDQENRFALVGSVMMMLTCVKASKKKGHYLTMNLTTMIEAKNA
jgi:hypothetical protein